MKTTLRALSVPAVAALSAPAFAHTDGSHDMSVIQTALHWASQPTHGLALLFGAAITVAAIVYTRRQRG